MNMATADGAGARAEEKRSATTRQTTPQRKRRRMQIEAEAK